MSITKRKPTEPFHVQILHVRLEIDPQEFSVNIRYKGGHTVPPGTRKAMDKLRDRVKSQADEQFFDLGATDYVKLDFLFAFGSWRSDLDNPLKRSIDALSEAVGVNDNRVVELHVTKKVVGEGNQFMEVTITTIPESQVGSPIGYKRPTSRPVWVSDEEDAE